MNFCPNCGVKQDQSAKFCSSCGHSIQEVAIEKPVVETAATIETQIKGAIKKRIPKKWLIPAIIIAIVIAGTTTFAFNLFASPKSLYLMAEYNSYKQLKFEWEEVYGNQYEFEKMLLEKPSSNELKVTGNFEIPEDAMDPEIAMIQEVLSKAAIMIKSEQDINNNVAKVNLGLQMDGANTIDMDIYQSPKLVGVSVPVLYDKAFYLNTSQFGQFMRNMDSAYEGPEELELNNLNWNKLRLSEEEIKSLSKRYGKFLVEELDEDNFTIEKGVSYEYNGDTMKLRKITLELTPKETEAFMKAFIDQLIQDEELHSLISNRVALVGKSAQFNQNDDTLTDPKKIKEEIRNGLKDMKEGLGEVSFPEGIKSVILIDKKEQIVDQSIELSVGDEYDTIAFEISGKNVPYGKNNRLQELKIEVLPESGEESKLAFSVANDIQNEKEQRVEDMKVNFHLNENSDVLADMTLNLYSEFEEYQDGKLDVTRDFELELNGTDYYGPFNAVSGNIRQKGETNLKKLTSNQKLNLVLSIAEGNESGKLKLSFDSNSAIKEDLKISSVNTKDGVNVAEITEGDIYDIQEEIGNRFMELMDEFGLNDEMSYQDDFSYFDDSYSDEIDYDNDFTSFYGQSGSELFSQSCASCHGQNLEGGVGPDLQSVGYYLDEPGIEGVILNGQGAMPAGMLQGDDARKVAKWLAEYYADDQYSYEGDDYANEDDVAYIDEYSVFSNSCASCHGQNLEGGVGPDLTTVGSRLSSNEVYSIITNGRGAMPAGLLDDQTAQAIADWLINDYY